MAALSDASPATPARSERWPTAAAALLLVLHAALAWLARPAGVLTMQDDAKYVLLGRALRSLSYRELWGTTGAWHAIYPPGFPAALAVWGTVVGERFDALILVNVVASVAALGLAFAIARKLAAPPVALGALAALALNPWLVERAGTLTSEPLFMLLGTLTVHRLLGAPVRARREWLVAVLASAAALTRLVGVTLLAGVGVEWLLARRWRAAALVTGLGAVTVGGWLLWSVNAPEQNVGVSYIADARFTGSHQPISPVVVVARRVARNVPAYLKSELPYRLAVPTVTGTIVDNAASSTLIAAGLATGLLVWWRRGRPVVLYLLAYAVLLAVWPWPESRFVQPLLPLLVPVLLAGLGWLAGRLRPRWGTPVAAGAAVLLAASGARATADQVARMRGCECGGRFPAASCVSVDQASYFAALADLAHRVPAGRNVLTIKAEPMAFYTGYRSPVVWPLLRSESSRFVERLRAAGVSHVLLASLQSSEPRVLAPRMLEHCSAFVTEGTYPPRAYLFRLVAPAEEGDGSSCRDLARYLEDSRTRDLERDP